MCAVVSEIFVGGIKLKTADDLKLMRPACLVAGKVLDEIGAFIKPGLTTRQVDEFAAQRIEAVYEFPL